MAAAIVAIVSLAAGGAGGAGEALARVRVRVGVAAMIRVASDDKGLKGVGRD